MLKIITDSCADLGQHLLREYDIPSIPLHVLVNEKDYLDNDLSLGELFRGVEETGQLPKTAAPSVLEFMKFFNHKEPVIYIGLSSKLSATMQNAEIAANQLKKKDLYLIDSLNLSTGIGLLVLKAVELQKNGLSLEMIVDQIKNTRQKVKTSFVIDTMEYLYKGGRCTGLQAVMGSVLKIRPIIQVQLDGTLGVLAKVRGSRKKALRRLLSDFEDDLPNIDLKHVFVTHTQCKDDAVFLVEELKKLAPIENIHTTLAGSTIASHCGPNTIGILYLKQ
jgi:DegV family protein with EDD domain